MSGNEYTRGLSRDQLRAIDRLAWEDYGIPTLVLMENAGRGAADWLRAGLTPSARVTIVCGPGNNGGDGGVVARHLDAAGYDVHVFWMAESQSLSADASTQFEILERAEVDQWTLNSGRSVTELLAGLSASDWIVDGLFGTGVTRGIEGPMAEAIQAINRSQRPVLALDLPSGLDCNTGDVHGIAVRASATITFVAPKIGFSRPGAGELLGEVVVAPLEYLAGF